VFWSPSTIRFFGFCNPFRNQLARARHVDRPKIAVDETPHAPEGFRAPAAAGAGRELIVAGYLSSRL